MSESHVERKMGNDNVAVKTNKLTELMEKWLEYFRGYCCENDVLGQLTFHILIGKIIKNVKFKYANELVGTRINLFVIQASGSGKGQTLKVAKKGSEVTDIKYVECLLTNDSAVVGTIYENKKKELITKLGALYNADILVFPEAEPLLKPGNFNKEMYAILQGALDEPGHVSKDMAKGKIEYDSNTSLIFTSYMTKEFNNALFEKGLFQRLLVVSRDFSLEQRELIQTFLLDSVLKEITPMPKELETALIELKKLGEANVVIGFDEESYDKFKKTYANYTAEIAEYVVSQYKGLIGTFLTRFLLQVLKIAVQSAVINGRKTVILEDLNYALELTKIHVESILHLLGQDSITKKEFLKIFKEELAKQSDKKMGKVELAKHLVKNTKIQMRMGEGRIQKMLEELAAARLIKKEKDPNSKNKYIFSLSD